MVLTCTMMLGLQNGKSLLTVLTYDVSLKYFVNVLLIKSTRYQNKMLATNTNFATFVLWSNQWHVLSVHLIQYDIDKWKKKMVFLSVFV
jgi:hypothetical protein